MFDILLGKQLDEVGLSIDQESYDAIFSIALEAQRSPHLLVSCCIPDISYYSPFNTVHSSQASQCCNEYNKH